MIGASAALKENKALPQQEEQGKDHSLQNDLQINNLILNLEGKGLSLKIRIGVTGG